MSKRKTTLENKTYHKNSIGRVALIALTVMFQLIILFSLLSHVGKNTAWIEMLLQLLAAILVIKICSEENTAAMKMPWIILMLVFPVVGVVLYYLVGGNIGTYIMRRRFNRIDSFISQYKHDDSAFLDELKQTDLAEYSIANYISKYSGYPVYKDTAIEYFSDTSEALDRQLSDMARAEHYIFMEYFSIENDVLWQRVMSVLEDRVKAGVEVRILYDDIGSIGYINTYFVSMMREKGIDCHIFNRVKPAFNLFFNNRDHRKITVIDGKVGYTGGYNMTNEYFNITHPYGMWKDAEIRLEGLAVRSLGAAFLEMWNAPIGKDTELDSDIMKYFNSELVANSPQNSFIVPYGDSPLDEIRVGEDVYLSMIEKADTYCYFMTPYLIVSDEMIRALSLASKRGVDIRIIIPGIPDKKLVYSITKSYSSMLANNGIRIYAWTPGFIHSKVCLVDGKMATCGSINLDYRSLYHHFEFGCFFCNNSAIDQLERDFNDTFAICSELTDEYKQAKHHKRFGQMLLRLFAELL